MEVGSFAVNFSAVLKNAKLLIFSNLCWKKTLSVISYHPVCMCMRMCYSVLYGSSIYSTI